MFRCRPNGVRTFVRTVVAILLLILAGAVRAADEIGLFFDEAYTTHEYLAESPPALVPLHLVLIEPSAAGGVAAWECQVSFEGPVSIVGVDYAGSALNVLNPPTFWVGMMGPPLPAAPAVRLATLQLLVPGDEPAMISLMPRPQPSIPDRMCYLAGGTEDEIVPVLPVTGERLAAWVNCTAEPACGITIQSLAFPERPVGLHYTAEVSVRNPSIAPLVVTPFLTDPDRVFSVENEGGSVEIEPLRTRQFWVQFLADEVGEFEGELRFGPLCPAVALHASSREAVVSWVVTEELDFGDVVLGEWLDLNVEISNTGESTLVAIVQLPPTCAGFSRPGGDWNYGIAYGTTCRFAVRFAPTVVGAVDCELSLGSILPPVRLRGAGVLPDTRWEAPVSLDFGDVDWGESRTLPVTITNLGPDVLMLDCALDSADTVFAYEGPGRATLAAGAALEATVSFTPPALGEYSCRLELGPVAPAIPLTGTSTTQFPAWTIHPDTLVLAPVLPDVIRTGTVGITNTGNVPLDLAPALDGAAAEFEIASGDAPGPLAPGQIRVVTIRFRATAAGTYATTLAFGPGLHAVPVTATVLSTGAGCRYEPQTALFGRTAVGSAATVAIAITNLDNAPLSLTPTQASPHFLVPDDPLTIAGGATDTLRIRFQPTQPGWFETDVDLGGEACAALHCRGEAVDVPQADQNIVGLYFDREFVTREAVLETFEVVPVHLALLNCSCAAGVGGWECRVQTNGTGIVLVDAQLQGQAINLLPAPSFLVGTGVPLLADDHGTLLATLNYYVSSHDPIAFELHPIAEPSLPGEMAWLTGDLDHFYPMRTPDGSERVASLNGAVQVGGLLPGPVALRQDREVRISWEPPDADFQACRLLRRSGAIAEPVGEPLPAGAGAFSFTDDLSGFEPGRSLYYSYGLYRDGHQIARSAEVEVIVPAAAQYVTGLLPNVPNPFNPQTEIRFQLESSSRARVMIYDVQGRRVRTLVDESLAAGPQARTWFGRDDAGRQVPSGAYYVRLETDGKIDTRKILLLK